MVEEPAVTPEANHSQPKWKTAAGSPWLYGDDPATGTDQLDRDRVVGQLIRAIEAVADQSPSSVIALVGPWGSGKTTLLSEIAEVLTTEAQWCVASYNPWAYSTYETAVLGFFDELAGALPEGTLGKDTRQQIGMWVSRLSPVGAIGGLVGVDGTAAIDRLGALVRGDQSPETLREKAAGALREIDHPVLVILDDLDRLQPPELLLTFKLVRLLGRLPNVYYLLAYDESTLEDTLARTDLIGTGPGRARQYLEKMVQVRLEVPPLMELQRLRLMNQGVDDLCARHSIELDASMQERLQSGWDECLSRYLDQPRAFKLLFTQVDALWPEVDGEVDFADFLHITFLRRFEPSVFSLILKARAELVGDPRRWPGSDKETSKERWERWRGMVKDAGAEAPDLITGLLAELFLVLRGARDNMSYSQSHRDDIRRRFGVDCAEFFDRYVQIGVPEGDVSQAEFMTALASLEHNQGAKEKVRGWLIRDATGIVGRFQFLQEIGQLPVHEVLLVMGDVYEQVSDEMAISGSGAYFIRSTARQLALEATADEPLLLTNELATAGGSRLTLAADMLRSERLTSPDAELLAQARSLVADQLAARVREAALHPIEDDARLVHDAWCLREFLGAEPTRELLWEVIGSSQIWTLEAFMALMVSVGTTSNGRQSWPSIGELSLGSVDDLLGLERVLAALPENLPQPDPGADLEFDRRRSGVTFADRQRYALLVLARAQASRRSAACSATDDDPPTPGSDIASPGAANGSQ